MDIDDQENNESIANQRSRQERYLELLDKVETLQSTENFGIGTADDLGHVLRTVNQLAGERNFEETVDNADQTLLDYQVISSASFMLKKCIQSVDVFMTAYESEEFAENIISFIKDDEDNYENYRDDDEEAQFDLRLLLSDARSIIPEVPECTYVYGAYDLDAMGNVQPKPKKSRMQMVRERLEKKEPEKVVNTQNKDEEGVEEIVRELVDVLNAEYVRNGGKPVRFYEFVIDTESFMRTVENAFHVAFLIRDGKAQFDLDINHDPLLKPTKKRELAQFREQEGANTQLLTQITMDVWQDFQKEGILQRHRK